MFRSFPAGGSPAELDCRVLSFFSSSFVQLGVGSFGRAAAGGRRSVSLLLTPRSETKNLLNSCSEVSGRLHMTQHFCKHLAFAWEVLKD